MNRRYAFATLFALMTLGATYGLILLGGLVHNLGYSLACPDWPLCFGQWFPEMTGGVLYEHGHRLLGAFVGLCSIVLAGLLWRPAAGYPSLRWLGVGLVGLVVFQGVLGGLTVILGIDPYVSTFHLGMSMIVLLTLVYLARACWLRWRRPGGPEEPAIAGGGQAYRLMWVALLAVYLQVILGAVVRHLNASHVAGVGWEYAFLGLDYNTLAYAILPTHPLSLINVLHRYFAVAVTAMLALSCARAFMVMARAPRPNRAWVAWLPVALVIVQIGVGIAMIGLRLEVVTRTLHLAVGTLVLLSTWLVTLGVGAHAPHLVGDGATGTESDPRPPLRPGLQLD